MLQHEPQPQPDEFFVLTTDLPRANLLPSSAFVLEDTLEMQEQKARVALGQLASLSQRRGVGFGGIGFVATTWSLAAPFLVAEAFLALATGNIPTSLLCGFGIATTWRLRHLQSENQALKISQHLIGAKVGWLESLLEGLSWGDAATTHVITLTLQRLLPQVTPEQRRLFSPKLHSILLDHLSVPVATHNPALIEALLAYVRSSQDYEAMSRVEMLRYNYHPPRFGAAARKGEAVLRDCQAVLDLHIVSDEEQLAALSSFTLPREGNSLLLTGSEVAEPQMSEQEHSAVQKLLAELEEESKKHRNPGMRLGFLIASWCLIVPYTGVQTVISLMGHQWGMGAMFAVMTGTATQLHRFALSPRQSDVAKRLARYGSKKVIGPLIEALDWPDEAIRSLALDALTDLLPTLNASDTNVLNQKQRGILYRSLRMSYAIRHERFLSAILEALEQVGDDEAVQSVGRLADAHAWHPAQKRIRQKAADCLPSLSIRAETNRASMTLLRPSSASEMSPDTLLRPMEERPDEAPEQLLRASNEE